MINGALNHVYNTIRYFFLRFSVCQNQILQITEACGVLIRYILNKFDKSTNSDIKLMLHALKSLCEGKSQDQDFDQIIFSSILRNAKYPEHKSNVTGKIETKKLTSLSVRYLCTIFILIRRIK